MKSKLWILFGLMPWVLVACSSGHPMVSGDPVYARVVDADTGKPIQGVAVMAYWELYQGSITGDGMPCAEANVEDAVTDKDGRFWIAGWGPIKGACGVMRNGNPHVYLFKPGYALLYMPGGVGLDVLRLVSVAQVDWNGKKLKMRVVPDANRSQKYAFTFAMFNSDIAMFIVNRPAECNWKRIPNMLRAIAMQRKAFDTVGNNNYGRPIDLDLTNDAQDKLMQRVAPQCGSPKKYVEGLEK